MDNKWLLGSALLLLISLLLMGWVFPMEEGLQAFLQISPNKHDPKVEEIPKSKQPPVLHGRIQKIEGKKLIVVDQANAEVKGYVTITEETKIFQKVEAELVKAKLEDLQEGMNVSVWQDDPILMIFPAQLTADELVVEK